MKIALLTVALLTLPVSGWAKCQLTASQQKISYGRVSPAERQLAQNGVLALPEKNIVINVLCDEPQRIRLMTGSSLPGNGRFALGDEGEMQIVATSARVDDRPVHIATVQSADAAPASGGHEQQEIVLNQGLAFMDGAEVRGKTASVTLVIHSRLKQTSISEKTTWHGNLNIRLETQ